MSSHGPCIRPYVHHRATACRVNLVGNLDDGEWTAKRRRSCENERKGPEEGGGAEGVGRGESEGWPNLLRRRWPGAHT